MEDLTGPEPTVVRWRAAEPEFTGAVPVFKGIRLLILPGLVGSAVLLFGIGLLHSHPSSRQPPYRSPRAAARSSADVASSAPAASSTGDDDPPTFEFQTLSPQEAYKINESIPISPLPNPAAKPFAFPAEHEDDRGRALQCLTQAVYYEAGSEIEQGQQAVAQVVLNRVRNPVYPKTVCGVVFQGSDRSTGCQFTFTCDGSLGRQPTAQGWSKAQAVATRALDGYVEKSVGNATHYHTVWVVPYWMPTLLKVARIGAHIFYRWVGTAGSPAQFTDPYGGAEPTTGAIALAQPGTVALASSDPLKEQSLEAPAGDSKPRDPFAPLTAPNPILQPVAVAPARLETPSIKPSVAQMAPDVGKITEPERPREGPSRLPVPHGW